MSGLELVLAIGGLLGLGLAVCILLVLERLAAGTDRIAEIMRRSHIAELDGYRRAHPAEPDIASLLLATPLEDLRREGPIIDGPASPAPRREGFRPDI